MSFNSSSSFGVSNDNTMVPMIDLTRAGWSNTAGQQRGTLQRVSYALVGDVLKRSYQVNLDTVQANKPVVQDLLTGVKGVQLRYLDGNQTWQNQWPVSSSTSINSTAPTTPATTTTPGAPGAPGAPINSATADLQSRPVAVELIIQFKDWGAVRRLIEVAG
jgi:type II secretion system protein J